MDPNINFVQQVQVQSPQWWRRIVWVKWLLVCVSAVRDLHHIFTNYRTAVLYDLHISGQTIYLEKALNDRFDFLARGIYIENINDLTQLYLYQKAEARPPFYLYNKYSATQVYAIGEFAVFNRQIWQAQVAGLLPHPPSPDWTNQRPFRPYLINKNEAGNSFDFIIHVPVGVTFDTAELRALVDRFKLAGKRYTIITY